MVGPGDVWREQDRRGEILRYAVAAAVVLGVAALGGVTAGQPPGPVSFLADDAVLIDLAPAPPSSASQQAVEDGPEQQANAAAPVSPPASTEAPRDPTPPEARDADVATAKPKAPETPPPQAPAPAVAERAPIGSQTPVLDAPVATSEEARAAKARAIDLWQRGMALRLDGARRRLGHVAHAAGKTVVGFTIDRDGHLVGSHIVTSSGCGACDAVALKLVAAASPYPVPPSSLPEDALSFVVPVRFNTPR